MASSRLTQTLGIMAMSTPPPHWNKDRLTHFIDAAYGNCWASFANLPNEYSWLQLVDEGFALVETVPKDSPILEAFLFARAQAAFRSAALLSMAGLAAECFCINRSCIESALYGLHINTNPQAGEIWIHRHTSAESEKKTRNEFAFTNVVNALCKRLPHLEPTARMLYTRAIDFGAHPNERAVSSALSMREHSQEVQFTVAYMTSDQTILQHAIKSTAQAGTFALLVNGEIFKDHYSVSGIDKHLQTLCAKL